MHVAITATGHAEIAALLEAALGDWVDFFFVPLPDIFTIFTDHDEYTTFYADEEANLSLLTCALRKEGFEEVRGWKREFRFQR